MGTVITQFIKTKCESHTTHLMVKKYNIYMQYHGARKYLLLYTLQIIDTMGKCVSPICGTWLSHKHTGE